MSIQNYFADFLEESPVDVAQLTTFSEHIPDEWLAKLKRQFVDVVYLVIWFFGLLLEWRFSAMSLLQKSHGE